MPIQWIHDTQVLLNGPPDGGSDSSVYYDANFKSLVEEDGDPEILVPYASGILMDLGVTRPQMALFCELERDSASRNRSRTPLGNVLSGLFRYRVPGDVDKGNTLYRSCIELWETFEESQADVEDEMRVTRESLKSAISLQGLQTFTSDQRWAIYHQLRAHRQHASSVDKILLVLEHADKEFTGHTIPQHVEFVKTINRPDDSRQRFRLADHLLICGVGHALGALPVTIRGADTADAYERIISLVQMLVYENRFALWPNMNFKMSDDERKKDYCSFVTIARTRKKVLDAYRMVAGKPDASFVGLTTDFGREVLRRGDHANQFVERLSWAGWPNLVDSERQNHKKRMKSFLNDQAVGCRVEMEVWTLDVDLRLIMMAFELGMTHLHDIALAMRRYGHYPSAIACERELQHLRAENAALIFHRLKGAAPNWWKAMGLPGNADRAPDQLYTTIRQHQASSIKPLAADRYDKDDDSSCATEDAQNHWLPSKPFKTLSEVEAYMKAESYFHSGLSSVQIQIRAQTVATLARKAIDLHVSNHLGSDPTHVNEVVDEELPGDIFDD